MEITLCTQYAAFWKKTFYTIITKCIFVQISFVSWFCLSLAPVSCKNV